MKARLYLTAALAAFVFCPAISAQEFDLTKFIDETRATGRKTAYQSYFEFTFDWSRTRDENGTKKSSETFEAVCSKKLCQYILTAKNGKSLPEKTVRKNRERAAQWFVKSEKFPEPKNFANGESAAGYGFEIMTSFSRWYSHFNPSIYLKNCRVDFIEKFSFESRPAAKLRAAECTVENSRFKGALEFMPETEAEIWVDEQDKAVIRMEVYNKNRSSSPPALAKSLVVMQAARVPEGFWFWKSIAVAVTANENFFPKKSGNWQIELYNYKPYTVLIDRVEIDKK